MTEITEPVKAIINIFIFGLPVLATLFLALNQARKRKLNKLESSAVNLVFWGFLLFASWENFQIPFTGKYGV
ncbi:MAG: hypothetical protein H8E40_16380 [Chloroflexi bacterium]|nr:hypothetical protein [Chloroflexota bacterium]